MPDWLLLPCDREVADFWKYSWAASRLVGLDEKEIIEKLLSEDKLKKEIDTVTQFSERKNEKHPMASYAKLYGATHSLVQSVLAAGKTKSVRLRSPQSGEKCPLCGEHEVLHDFKYEGTTSAKEYSSAVNDFWNRLRSATNSEGSSAQTGEHERLCAVCAVKE